ncbi:MAG: SDR family NAD(P)-dependent oxidoreductase, partial [Nocardioidaceae bacterium]
MPTLPLAGRVAVVSGVSRRRGIGFAVAKRLASLGASLFIQHYGPHDAGQPWGADHIEDVLAELQAALVADAHLGDVGLDLAAASAAETLIEAATSQLGHLDVLVCNHAQSGNDGPLSEVTAAQLDQHWQVNARSTVLATRAFAAQHDGREGGRVIWMTSGQGKGPMSETVAYAMSKAALAGLTTSVADTL